MNCSDLDDDKKAILQKFRNAVQDVLQLSHDDRFLLRWLRARNFCIKEAERMLRVDVEFRKKFGSDTIADTYELRKELQQYECNAFLGFDNDGHIVRLYNAGECDCKGMARCMTITDIYKYFICVFETDLKNMKENNEKNGTDVETFVYISDFTGLKLSQFYDRTVIRNVIQTIKFYQDHYPETLHVLYIINVPNFFSYIFNIFKPFFNDVVLSKIHIFGYDGWQDELFSKIPKEIVPAYLGGSRYGPNEDPLCSDIMNWRGKIPPSLYLTNFCSLKMGDPGVCEKVIRQRSLFEIEKGVTKSGTLLCWEFQTKRYDIRFGLFLKKKMKNGEKGKYTKEELLPVENIECSDTVEKSDYLCKKVGTYILLFDNTYSWFTSKHLLYKTEVKPPSAQSSLEDLTH